MRKIAVLTSGGDAPGMNAAIRAVVRTGIDQGWEVFGVRHGYSGLIYGNMEPMTAREVGGIIQEGGTVLGSARAPEFKTEEAQQSALRMLRRNRIEGLVVIGGNGSQKGSEALARHGYPVVGIASTIDNDLYGTDISLGVDTALEVALEAIDRLKVTASSHTRAFVVEVMGRDTGYLALASAVAGGADYVVIPEVEIDPEDLVNEVRGAYERGKAHAMIVVAEGARYNANGLMEYFTKHQARIGFELRVTILGYVQRGGAPTAFDRFLGTRFGAYAVDCLERGETGVLVGLKGNRVGTTPLSEVVANRKTVDLSLFKLVEVLSR